MRESISFRIKGSISQSQLPRKKFSRKGAKAQRKPVFEISLCAFAPLREKTIPVHGNVGDLVFLGLGTAAAKSVALLRVSVQPFAERNTALMLLGAGAGAEPLKQFAVVP